MDHIGLCETIETILLILEPVFGIVLGPKSMLTLSRDVIYSGKSYSIFDILIYSELREFSTVENGHGHMHQDFSIILVMLPIQNSKYKPIYSHVLPDS